MVLQHNAACSSPRLDSALNLGSRKPSVKSRGSGQANTKRKLRHSCLQASLANYFLAFAVQD